ncbi:MAG: DUF3810 domain-containing protein [Candidatus Limivicinus sp.]
METRERKIGLKAVYKLSPVAHTVALVSAVVILLHLALRDNQPLMARFAEGFLHPMHEKLALLCDRLGYFSVAEALIWGFIAFLLAALTWRLVKLIRGDRWRNLYRLVMLPVSAVLFVYAGYSALWGTYYYADDFLASGGFESREISVDELETVTRYFAARLNELGAEVQRDEQGFYTLDRRDILGRSREIYNNTEALHPRLTGPAVSAKAIASSHWLSYLDFTGFFFPFTGEACVNTDFPVSLFPSTVAHELAHQRGVAREQDANFVAVLSSLESGDLDYGYSACLLAYIHLGNALYSADYSRWEAVYKSLSEEIRLDMALNNAYWRQFETSVQTVSNTVHEGLLQSYDQQLGLKSYGACVDLLVCHYLNDARAYFSAENTD